METERDRQSEPLFYLGTFGPWIPVACLMAGMAGSIFLGGGIFQFCVVVTLSIFVGFLLSRKKAAFGDLVISALANKMLVVLVASFLFAGILSQLLKASGLVEALLWIAGSLSLSSSWIPFISFLLAAAIALSCGTAAGSITAVVPVMMPLTMNTGGNPGLACGAIISGAILGNNLAPTSDVVIAASLTQETSVSDVISSSLPVSPGCLAHVQAREVLRQAQP